MSHHHLDVVSDLWFVAYTEERGIIHYGFAESPATITSGQHDLETFATEAEMAAKVDELKGQPGWYESHKPAPAPDQPVSNVT